jgi:hypothetical protein
MMHIEVEPDGRSGVRGGVRLIKLHIMKPNTSQHHCTHPLSGLQNMAQEHETAQPVKNMAQSTTELNTKHNSVKS